MKHCDSPQAESYENSELVDRLVDEAGMTLSDAEEQVETSIDDFVEIVGWAKLGTYPAN